MLLVMHAIIVLAGKSLNIARLKLAGNQTSNLFNGRIGRNEVVMKFVPPKNTVPTAIYDIYGQSILVWFPKNDKESPKNVEKGIRQAQLGHTK